MDLQVREAIWEDARIIADFNVAMALETEGKRLCPETVQEGVREALGRPELAQYFVAVYAGEVVGQLMVTYEWSDWRNGMFWWIQSVYVRPDARRRGVFHSLYRQVEQVARETAGVCGLRLYVDQNNEQAMSAYRELGMVASGHLLFETDWALDRPDVDA
jgi:GNAT superfamily N-acetyltransferase